MPTLRVPDRRFAEPIGEAIATIGGLHRWGLEGVRFWCGVDPVWSGLHRYAAAADGRPFSTTAHACYPHHLVGPADRRQPTVVLPVPVPPWTVVHELGHLLHHRQGLKHRAAPITAYAARNHQEAFAEAFVARFYVYGDQDAWGADKATHALFDQLDTKETL